MCYFTRSKRYYLHVLLFENELNDANFKFFPFIKYEYVFWHCLYSSYQKLEDQMENKMSIL